MKDFGSQPNFLSTPPDNRVNLRFSSCSQYQSEESSVRSRKRASLSRNSSLTALSACAARAFWSESRASKKAIAIVAARITRVFNATISASQGLLIAVGDTMQMELGAKSAAAMPV